MGLVAIGAHSPPSSGVLPNSPAPVGAVYDRAFFPGINEIRAVIARAYSRFRRFAALSIQEGSSATRPFKEGNELASTDVIDFEIACKCSIQETFWASIGTL
jgi:hypothetical protein